LRYFFGFPILSKIVFPAFGECKGKNLFLFTKKKNNFFFNDHSVALKSGLQR